MTFRNYVLVIILFGCFILIHARSNFKNLAFSNCTGGTGTLKPEQCEFSFVRIHGCKSLERNGSLCSLGVDNELHFTFEFETRYNIVEPIVNLEGMDDPHKPLIFANSSSLCTFRGCSIGPNMTTIVEDFSVAVRPSGAIPGEPDSLEKIKKNFKIQYSLIHETSPQTRCCFAFDGSIVTKRVKPRPTERTTKRPTQRTTTKRPTMSRKVLDSLIGN